MKRKAKVEISIIRSEKQYRQYLSLIDELMDKDPAAHSAEGRLLETVAILCEVFENQKGWEIPGINDPVEVIKLRMQDLNLKRSDLIPVIGDKTTVSRILNRSRKLTYSMVLPLSELLRIPPEFLLTKEAA